MRVSVSFSLCLAMAAAMGATNASAQMNADEIFNRLKAQAGSTGTVQAAPNATTRGLAVVYDDKAPAAAAARPTPSVVAAPRAVTPTAVPAQTAAPSYTAVAAPTVAAPSAAARPVPTYTAVEQPSAPAYTAVEPASATFAAPAPSPTYQAASQPTYTVEQPSYVETQPAVAQPMIATPAVVRTDPTVYQAVEESTRVDLRIYFEWNSASLKSEAIGQLAELCSAIRRVGASGENQFKIIGHTDKSGSDDYNLYLSNARAREVKRHLVEECALPSNALLAVGEGERQSSPSTPSNAPEERRVEIQFVS